MYVLLLLFILIPAIEISIFIWTGSKIGGLAVFLLIILTGVIGAALVKKQGIETWRSAQLSMYNHEIPKRQIMDGICLILGGILLITPGFVTDIAGFLLVLPWTRPPFRNLIYHQIVKRMNRGDIIFRRW